MKGSIIDSLREAVQTVLQQQREAANEVQAALDLGDVAALRSSVMRLMLITQRLTLVQDTLDSAIA